MLAGKHLPTVWIGIVPPSSESTGLPDPEDGSITLPQNVRNYPVRTSNFALPKLLHAVSQAGFSSKQPCKGISQWTCEVCTYRQKGQTGKATKQLMRVYSLKCGGDIFLEECSEKYSTKISHSEWFSGDKHWFSETMPNWRKFCAMCKISVHFLVNNFTMVIWYHQPKEPK